MAAQSISVILSSISLLVSSSHIFIKNFKHCKSYCFSCDYYEDGDSKDVESLMNRIDSAISLLEEVKRTPRNQIKGILKQSQMETSIS